MSRTRRRLLGLLAATLLVLATIPISAFGSSDSNPGYLDSSRTATLTLTTGNETLTVTFKETGQDPVSESQPLRKRDKCVVETGKFSSLIGIALDGGGGIGLVSNGLGSTDGKNCSSGNGRVEEGKNLIITMPHGWIATGGELDIEGKFGASLDVTTYVGDDTIQTEPTTIALNTDANSDNGADSGASDNTLVDLDDVEGEDLGNFTALQLSPHSIDGRGEISLEGGGDDPSLSPTTFELSGFYEYSLDCPPNDNDISADFANDDNAGSAFGAEVTRYDTTDKTRERDTCAPIGINLSSDGDGITLVNSDTDEFGNPQAPNLRLVLTWRVELKDADGNPRPMDGPGGVYEELDRKVDLLDESVPQSAQYCLTNNDAGGFQPANQPDGANWCLLSDSTKTFDGYLIQTQVYDGAGDPRFF